VKISLLIFKTPKYSKLNQLIFSFNTGMLFNLIFGDDFKEFTKKQKTPKYWNPFIFKLKKALSRF